MLVFSDACQADAVAAPDKDAGFAGFFKLGIAAGTVHSKF